MIDGRRSDWTPEIILKYKHDLRLSYDIIYINYDYAFYHL